MNVKNTQDDFLGYQQALRDVLVELRESTPEIAGQYAADALFCLGRCLQYGLSIPDEAYGEMNGHTLELSQTYIASELKKWTESARDLPSHWDDTWQDDEAALLCQSILELRMDSWAAELALANLKTPITEALRLALDKFDDCLRDQRNILATVCDTTWWENLRQAVVIPNDVWWLSESLSNSLSMVVREAVQTLPSTNQWVNVRAQALWNDAMPEVAGALAAATDQPIAKIQCVQWIAPCGSFAARLMVPQKVSSDELKTPRSLYIVRLTDESLATEFSGQVFSLGNVSGIFDQQATCKVKLSEIMSDCDGSLRVGQPAQVWRIELEPPLALSERLE